MAITMELMRHFPNMFSKGKSKVKLIEDMSVTELINNIPHVDPMNSRSIIEEDDGTDTRKYWVNPDNQMLFNYGNFSRADFIDWAYGKGKIVKGKNAREKAAVMDYYEKSQGIDWRVFSYWEWLDRIPNKRNNYRPSSEYMFSDDVELIDKSKDTEEIIIDVFSNIVHDIKDDLQWYFRKEDKSFERDTHHKVEKKYRDILYGTSRTLSMLGYGSFGACNTPEIIKNLSWTHDLIFAKAYYLLYKKNGIEFPNVELVNKISRI